MYHVKYSKTPCELSKEPHQMWCKVGASVEGQEIVRSKLL
jgi:hypothetical protein